MDMERIMVVAAHPDDDVLGCGATIRKLVKAGKAVRIVFIGEGSTCQFERDKIDSDEAKELIAHRTACALEALQVLAVEDFVFHNLPCGRFDTVPIIDIGKTLEKELAAFRPDTVFTHFIHDTNMDHRLAYQATLQAARPVPTGPVRNLLSFEILSSTEWKFTETFTPNYFVNVEHEIKDKIKALGKYSTEQRPFPFPRSPEGLDALARIRGMQVGCPIAEAFYIVRSVED